MQRNLLYLIEKKKERKKERKAQVLEQAQEVLEIEHP